MKKTMIANRSMTYGTRRLAAGDLFTASRRDAGLLSALKRARPAGPEPEIAIPDDWQALAWPKLRSLASQLSDEPIAKKADALAAITAEINKRAAKGR